MGHVETNRAFARKPPENLKNIRFILVEPQTPGNVGSACRAMKTMGLSDLVLVRPEPFRDVTEARNLAHGSYDLLDNARVVDTLEEAVGDVCLVAGTTNRRRIGVLPDMLTVKQAAERLVEASRTQRVGVLFGREDRGLSTSDLSHCQIIATIPVAEGMPSLNLSHAVQVLAYEMFQYSLGERAHRLAPLAVNAEREALVQRVMDLLLSIGFTPFKDDPQTYTETLRRVFGRVGLEQRDARALHKLIATVQHYIAQHCRE